MSAPIEGELRVKEFQEYLSIRNLSQYVWLSEDATRITGKLEYNPTTNEVTGFVLPINKTTGMPVTLHFSANSALHIYNLQVLGK
jgi:hypothetical protein